MQLHLKFVFLQLKFYGGSEETISIIEHPEFIGFTLPSTSVSSKIVPIGSDVILVNLYSLTLCTLYAITICLVTVWYYQPSSAAEKTIKRLIDENAELTTGIRITSSTALVIEFITRLATCIVWTVNIKNSLGILLAVWMPQIHLLVMGAVQILFIGIYICCHSKGGCYETESQLRTFSNLSATTFTLFYLFFPTIILMFAYPTQIIVIFSFVIAYLFATSIFSAGIVKLYKKLHSDKHIDETDGQSLQRALILKKALKGFAIFMLFISLWIIILYLHFLVVFGAYSLLVGRGSVINTGPSFIISLIPSVILTGGAWLAKKLTLDQDQMSQSLDSMTVTNYQPQQVNNEIHDMEMKLRTSDHSAQIQGVFYS